MRRFMYMLEHNRTDLIIGAVAVLMFYAFARLLGARVHIALAFSMLPLFVGWAYRTGALRGLFGGLF